MTTATNHSPPTPPPPSHFHLAPDNKHSHTRDATHKTGRHASSSQNKRQTQKQSNPPGRPSPKTTKKVDQSHPVRPPMALVPARGDLIDLTSFSRPAAASPPRPAAVGLEAPTPARGEPALARPVAVARGEGTPLPLLPAAAALARRALMLLAVVLALLAERAERADIADLTDSCNSSDGWMDPRRQERGEVNTNTCTHKNELNIGKSGTRLDISRVIVRGLIDWKRGGRVSVRI